MTALLATGLATATSAQAAPEPDPDKIKPKLAKQLKANGEATTWIRFEARADLSGPSRIADWDKRGKAVHKELAKTAKQSQKRVRRELDKAGVAYQAFHATNAIRVEGASKELARQLTEMSEVESLWPAREYEMVKPIKGKDIAEVNAVEWGIANINADDVWDQYGAQGEGITVANIDTGVQFDHPALGAHYRGNNGDGTFTHDYNWFDAANACDGEPCDGNGHGTHTMGTMLGDDGGENQVGVAPAADWIAANGCCPSDAALIASGEWMLAPTDLNGENPDASKRPHIVNNSWGTQVPSNDPFMEDVQNAWKASGIFGAWSNGNNGPGCETSGSPGSRTINYSVGAYDVNNNIAGFSSRGPGQDGEIKPNIAAPGVNVRSSLPGNSYGSYNGTSMAAPHLAGAIALLWSAAPGLVGDIDSTRDLLDQTATDTADDQCGGTADDNNVYGEGRLDALALIDAAPVGDTGFVEGTVTDAASGDPLADATVSFTGELEREVTTDADGAYSVRLPAGGYTMTASKFGYADQTAEVTLPAGETLTQDFALEAMPSVSVNGQVLDGSGHGWPLYAKVSVDGVEGASTYTHPGNGRYRLTLPAGSTYTLQVESQYDGYETVTKEVEVGGANERVDIDVPVVSSCVADGYGFNHGDPALSETFDANEVPADWTVTDNIDNGLVWRFDNPEGDDNETGGEGNFAVANTDDAEQNTDLVSPVMDLTGQGTPILEFQQDFSNFANRDLGQVDVSVDGGETWETVLSQEVDVFGPDEQIVPIPQAGNESEVQVRFHYESGDDGSSWYWHVDDVVVRNRSCDPVPGGLVYGHVRDRNTKEKVNGATVTSIDAPDDTATTRATPDDEARQDGFYSMFSSVTGQHQFEASKGNYRSHRATADVAPDWATRRNFALMAGQLTVEPSEVSATIPLGDNSAEKEFTVTNTGGESVEVEFSERGGGFEMLRADGQRMTRKQITEADGAPLKKIKAPTSFAAKAKSRMGTNDKAPQDGPADAPWTDIADYPSTVMDSRVVHLDGKVYSVGGGNGSASTAEVFVYDPATLAWEPVAELPGARNAMTVGVVDGKIVASGGWGPSGPDAATWVYDPAGDSWSEAADNPTPRAAAGQAVLDGKLYAVGGCTTASCTPMASDVVAFDLATDSWESLADYPASVAFASCGAIEGMLYCTGGNDGGGGTADSYVYDPGADSWSEIADAPVDTWASQYAVANGRLIVNGGVQGASVTNATFAYDPGADSWSDLPNSNTARYRGAAACGLYKVGGSSGGFNATPDSEVLPGFTECAVAADVEWMSIDTTEATLAPGESVTVTVSMSAEVDQPGAYTGGVRIGEDSPYSVDPVAVTMNVTPPETWGKLAGTVTGVTCDAEESPLEGATVQVDSWAMDWTFSTEADGTYAQWVDHRNNPLQLIAAKDGYQPQFEETEVQPGETTTEDFALEEVGC